MKRLLTATTEMFPLLVAASILFAVSLMGCAGDQGNPSYGDAGAAQSDGATGEQTSSAGGSNDTGGQVEPSEQADQNPVADLHSGEPNSSGEDSGGEAGSPESASANPVADLPRRETKLPVFIECPEDQGHDCAFFSFDADGDGIGAGVSELYAPGKEPPGWVYPYPDNCPDVYNPGTDQYGMRQPDSDGDGVGDACDPDAPGRYGDASGQYSDDTGLPTPTETEP